MNKLVLLSFVALILGSLQTQADLSVATCKLGGEGIYGGEWKKHRLIRGEEVLYGADDMQSLIQQFQRARSEGLCQN